MAFIEMDPNGAWAKSPRWLKIAGGLGAALIFMAIVAPEPAPEPAAVTTSKAAPGDDARVTAKLADDRRRGFHCLSAWDGSNPSFVKQVKEQLRNPDSFRHAETTIGPVLKSGNHAVKMTYRAENGFGGMNVETAIAAVDQNTCEATIISSAPQMERLLPAS